MTRRILWVAKGLGPGGAEHLLVELARHGLGADVAIDTAYVLAWKDHLAEPLHRAGVSTTCLSTRHTDRRWPLRLARMVRGGHYDVVHIHSPLPGAVARLAVWTMRPGQRPLVVTTEHNRAATYRAPTRWLARLTSRWDAATIAVSQQVADSLSGPAGRRAEVLRHGIDVPGVRQAHGQRDRIRSELGIAAEETVVVTVANFREQKDYPNLLGAVRILADRRISFRLVAVGQGPDEQRIRRLSHEMGLDDHVLFTGFRADARPVLAAGDIFVLASKWEGLPVAAMEATALGLPMVATQVGGIAEQWTDGHDARLVPAGDPQALADALQETITDPDARTRLSAAAMRRAADFDISGAADRYRRLYGAAAAAPAAAPSAPARRPLAAGIEIRPATAHDRGEVLALLGETMGHRPDDAYAKLFRWKHDDNPFGASPAWVAVDGHRVVAVRMMMRWEFQRGGEVQRAVRAVDTATASSHQGRGLFSALTRHALHELAETADFVFNTPNSQSRPGYLKMGWQEVGRLPASFGVGRVMGLPAIARARVPATLWSVPIDVGLSPAQWLEGGGLQRIAVAPAGVRALRTHSSPEYWAWRLGLDGLHYRVIEDGDDAVVCRVRRRGEATELVLVAAFGDPRRTDAIGRRVARQLRCDYVLRLGHAAPRHGLAPVPGGGPLLTWRAISQQAMPPLSNWELAMSDIELF